MIGLKNTPDIRGRTPARPGGDRTTARVSGGISRPSEAPQHRTRTWDTRRDRRPPRVRASDPGTGRSGLESRPAAQSGGCRRCLNVPRGGVCRQAAPPVGSVTQRPDRATVENGTTRPATRRDAVGYTYVTSFDTPECRNPSRDYGRQYEADRDGRGSGCVGSGRCAESSRDSVDNKIQSCEKVVGSSRWRPFTTYV